MFIGNWDFGKDENNLKNYQPIIIVGAPRSGTNMLREVICKLPGVGTWPCDEINFIWRHGNIGAITDAFPAEYARPAVIRYIRKRFDSLARTSNLDFVVEKTCANSLRIPFVKNVIPNAKYIFIYRNGIDVVASANLRWTAKLDLGYILEKARFVPFTDLPYYFVRFVMNRLYRLFSDQGRLAFWGPQLEDMNTLLSKYSLEQVCAIQWSRCVNSAEAALAKLPEDHVIRVKYEDFVADPQKEFKNICQALEIPATGEEVQAAVESVSRSSVGKGSAQMDEMQLESLSPMLEETLSRLGYR